MPKLEANLQWMFNEYDVLIDMMRLLNWVLKVEIQSPYDLRIHEIKQKLNTNNLKQIIINTNIIDNDTGISNLILRSDKTEIYKTKTYSIKELCSRTWMHRSECWNRRIGRYRFKRGI